MNQFGKTSRFEIKAACTKNGQTFIKDSFFTAPFKIMKPFPREKGGITVFQQSASPGLLAGDSQEIDICLEQKACLEIASQSFEKVFKMEEDEKACRKISLKIGAGATLIYAPNPCIPFAQSNFYSHTEINLEEDSRLIYEDIFCAGRVATGEVFDFSTFQNLIEVTKNDNLIFRDNTYYNGREKRNLTSQLMFGSYTHCGSLLIFGYKTKVSEIREALKLEEKLLYTGIEEESSDLSNKLINDILIEVSNTDSDDIIVRALSKSAQSIQELFKNLINRLPS